MTSEREKLPLEKTCMPLCLESLLNGHTRIERKMDGGRNFGRNVEYDAYDSMDNGIQHFPPEL